MTIPFALISLAVGYKVFVDASKENISNRRSFGRIIGIFIMTMSFALSTAPFFKYACAASSGNSACSLMSKICPMR